MVTVFTQLANQHSSAISILQITFCMSDHHDSRYQFSACLLSDCRSDANTVHLKFTIQPVTRLPILFRVLSNVRSSTRSVIQHWNSILHQSQKGSHSSNSQAVYNEIPDVILALEFKKEVILVVCIFSTSQAQPTGSNTVDATS